MKPHEYTHTGDRVLIVKCLNRDGTGYGGFKWPKQGPVENKHWSREPNCESGGLFGWPWGIGISDGKDPDALAPWLVFSAKPENVIGEIEKGQKCKAVPGKDGDLPVVVYYGTQSGAMAFTMTGRCGWIEKASGGSASQTGNGGSASQTGDGGSASQAGHRGSASQTGNGGSASQTGNGGSASQTGDGGSASQTGYRGSASQTGYRGIAAVTGEKSTIEIGKNAIGASTANRFTWIVRKGANLFCQWSKDGKKFNFKHFNSATMRVKDGTHLKIQFGKIVKEFSE